MKRVIYAMVGILAFSVACQDNFVEQENYLSENTKSARVEKVKTFQIKGWVMATPDPDQPDIACAPVEAGVTVKGIGWVSGHDNIFGEFDPAYSTFENEYCEFEMTPEGPVVYAKTNVVLQRMSGDKMFIVNHMWINVVAGVISGYNDVLDGTGRFEGVTGWTEMLNGKIDLQTGIAIWDESGYLNIVLK